MKGGRNSSKWSLLDIIDLEVLLEKSALWKKSWRNSVREEVESLKPKTELERRKLGLRRMLDEVRESEPVESGERVQAGIRALEVVVWLLMLLVGVGVLRSLLVEFEYAYQDDASQAIRGYNIWVLLGVGLGLQWLMLIIGFLGYWLWRRWTGGVSFLHGLLQWLARRFGGNQLVSTVWKRLQEQVRGGRGVLAWRLARVLQSGGIGYNVGLLLGLFGCLLFFEVGFFWESTLPQFGKNSLVSVGEVLSLSWSEVAPSELQVDQARRGAVLVKSAGSMTERNQVDLAWGLFFFFAISVWGLMPRVLMWLACWAQERKTLAAMDFQEARHRALWREVTGVQRGEVKSSASDGVVVLDVGGLELSTDVLRPFLLQTLRVNPEARFSLGTLSEEGEQKALEAAKVAAMGVVFLVEGWNLSPKQMAVYHDRVRSMIGSDHMIRYVVIGSTDEMRQWEAFVDSLRDSESEVYCYNE